MLLESSGLKWLLNHPLASEHLIIKRFSTVKWLISNCNFKILISHAIDKCGTYGHRQFLQTHKADRTDLMRTEAPDSWRNLTDAPILLAAISGHIVRCDRGAVDNAASQGHLEVIEWLHTNRSEGCSRLAIKNFSYRCTSNSMCQAAENGYLSMVKRLNANMPESHTARTINYAVQYCHLDVATLLSEASFNSRYCCGYMLTPLMSSHRIL
ncbi:hypothetical protein CCR75_006493 [Bremia lactucae]|uniref:Ankyrin repeat-containing domain n=1 Tax=Bremia lactucae TaxID=4779 RepID=A0A976FRY6_BRELC|nr:hypothetical protein CCR75_006493 [Bremia lactucae]